VEHGWVRWASSILLIILRWRCIRSQYITCQTNPVLHANQAYTWTAWSTGAEMEAVGLNVKGNLWFGCSTVAVVVRRECGPIRTGGGRRAGNGPTGNNMWLCCDPFSRCHGDRCFWQPGPAIVRLPIATRLIVSRIQRFHLVATVSHTGIPQLFRIRLLTKRYPTLSEQYTCPPVVLAPTGHRDPLVMGLTSPDTISGHNLRLRVESTRHIRSREAQTSLSDYFKSPKVSVPRIKNFFFAWVECNATGTSLWLG